MEPDKLTDLEDKAWMREALKLADLAAAEGEVPVGAVIVKDGVLISAGRNRRELGKNALYHAEPVSYTHLQSWKRLTALAKPWAAGGCGSVTCMLPWSHVPCVPALSSTPGFGGFVTVLKIQKRVPVGQSSIFLSFRTIISPR